jgi:thioredoxin-related protein
MGRLWMTVLAAVLAGTALAEPPDGYPFVPFDVGLRAAREQGKPVLVYFGRYGCGYCEKTNREVFSVAEVRERYAQQYVLVYVDAEGGRRLTLPSGERITEKELGPRLQAFVTPVFLYLDPDGQVLLKQAGLRTVEDFLRYDEYVRGGHYRAQTLREFEASRQ